MLSYYLCSSIGGCIVYNDYSRHKTRQCCENFSNFTFDFKSRNNNKNDVFPEVYNTQIIFHKQSGLQQRLFALKNSM